MTLAAVWTSPPEKDGWSETISKPADGDQVEVGLLGTESNAADIEDLKMGGLLGVVGKDKALSKVLSLLSRHLYADTQLTKLTNQNQQCSPSHHDTNRCPLAMQNTPSRSTTPQVSIQP